MYDISFNDVKASSIGILPVRRPGIPAPEPRLEEITIPGRDGSLISLDGLNGEITYNSITINVEFNFWAKPHRWAEVFRAAKKWIKGSGNLILGDDTSFFYKVLSCKISDSERTSLRIGTFTAEFLCDPYLYVKDGQREMSIADVLYNPYALSKPIYLITGEENSTSITSGFSLSIIPNWRCL